MVGVQDLVRGGIDEENLVKGVLQHLRHAKQRLACLKQKDDQFRQLAQCSSLRFRELFRLTVNDAQCAQRQPSGIHQRITCIKSYLRIAEHQGVVFEPAVLGRVRHFHQFGVQNRMRTERYIPGGFLNPVQPLLRLEPLAVAIDKADKRSGNTTNRRC